MASTEASIATNNQVNLAVRSCAMLCDVVRCCARILFPLFRVAEYVVKPMYRSRRRKIQTGLNKAKIVTVTRAQNQAMIAEANRAAVAVSSCAAHRE
jgi:hypothetical protein